MVCLLHEDQLMTEFMIQCMIIVDFFLFTSKEALLCKALNINKITIVLMCTMCLFYLFILYIHHPDFPLLSPIEAASATVRSATDNK